MISVSLPCPSCATPLLLDGENAGLEVLCPGCQSRLRMPTRLSAKERPELLQPPGTPPPTRKNPKAGKKDNAGGTSEILPINLPASPLPGKAGAALPEKPADKTNPAGPTPGTETTGPAPKSLIPQGRTKSAEDEIKRLAGAAAAAGGAHAFHPEDITLPADRQKTILPTRRNVGLSSPEEAPAEGGHLPTALPTRRVQTTPPGAAPPQSPIEPKPDVEISATPLRGPSKFVGPVAEAPALAPAPRPTAAVPTPAAEPDQEAPKGGFRLGGGRSLHFSPVPVTDAEAEAPTWGSQQDDPQQAARSRRLVSIALVLVLLGLGGLGIYGLRLAFDGSATAADAPDGTSAGAANENVMRNVEEARRVLERFLAADSLDKLAAEVRHPEVTRPRMERFYGDTVIKPRKKRNESQSWSEVRIGDREFIRAAWELDDFRIYQFNLEIMPGGEPKIDWESLVHWSEMPWKDFLTSPPEEAYDFRVSVTHEASDQYYNYSFKGQELEMMCFKLEDPDKYGFCWAYCHKDSEAASSLLFHLKRARQQGVFNAERKAVFSCILRLRFPPEGRKTNQVLIEKLVHDSWVQP